MKIRHKTGSSYVTFASLCPGTVFEHGGEYYAKGCGMILGSNNVMNLESGHMAFIGGEIKIVPCPDAELVL